jgi:hypothetical protein
VPPHVASPRRNRGHLFALSLVVVVLAVVGGSTGYFLGLRELHLRDVAADHDAGGGSASGSSQGAGKGSASPVPSGKPCLAETEALARQRAGSPGRLTQVMYIRTVGAQTGSEVWICRDSNGRLFYQGHRLSAEETAGAPREKLVEGDNALFLLDPVPDGVHRYIATNTDDGKSTTYTVTATTLTIVKPSGATITENVVANQL